jgi:hypothetical protein
MDLKLHRPRGTCARTGRPFTANETFYSALVRAEGGLDRFDCAAEAWAGPPEGTLAWWQSRYAPKDPGGPTLAPADVLLDVIEELDGRPEDAALRYLIALELVRRRVLRIVEQPAAKLAACEPQPLVLACRKRDRDYVVPAVAPADASAGGVEERLQALLWSGGAA